MEKNILVDRDAITAQLSKNLLENLSRFVPNKKERTAMLYDWIIQSFQMTNCVLKVHKTINQFFTASNCTLLLEAYDMRHTDIQLFKLCVKDLNYDNDRRDFGLMNDLSVVLGKLNFASKILEFVDSDLFHESGIIVRLSEPVSLHDRTSGGFEIITSIKTTAIKLDRKGLDQLIEIATHESAIGSLLANQEFWHSNNIAFRLGQDNFIIERFGECNPPAGFNYLKRVLRLTKENVDEVQSALNKALGIEPVQETDNSPAK